MPVFWLALLYAFHLFFFGEVLRSLPLILHIWYFPSDMLSPCVLFGWIYGWECVHVCMYGSYLLLTLFYLLALFCFWLDWCCGLLAGSWSFMRGVRFPRGRVLILRFLSLNAMQLLVFFFACGFFFFFFFFGMSFISSSCASSVLALGFSVALGFGAALGSPTPSSRKAKKKYAQESKGSLLLSDCYLSVNRYSLCSAGVRGNTREDPDECCWRQSFLPGCRAQWQGLFALVRGVGGSHTPTNNI